MRRLTSGKMWENWLFFREDSKKTSSSFGVARHRTNPNMQIVFSLLIKNTFSHPLPYIAAQAKWEKNIFSRLRQPIMKQICKKKRQSIPDANATDSGQKKTSHCLTVAYGTYAECVHTNHTLFFTIFYLGVHILQTNMSRYYKCMHKTRW